MLGKCFFILTALSVTFAAFTGHLPDVANAIPDGAAASVDLTLTLAGNMCLWCGIMEVLRRAGAITRVSRILAPILGRIFPNAWQTGTAKEEITAAVSANLLGIGNAATPFALEAMSKMDKSNPTPETATDDMVTFTVLGTAAPNLLPTTIIALRRAAGSASPFAIIIPVWICSIACSAFAVVLSRAAALVKFGNCRT